MTLEERVARWPEPYIRQGIERGIEQGIERGIERGIEQGIERGIEGQRALLRRMAAARFGEDTAERLHGMLRREANPERLAALGEAIVRCETSEDLLRTAGA